MFLDTSEEILLKKASIRSFSQDVTQYKNYGLKYKRIVIWLDKLHLKQLKTCSKGFYLAQFSLGSVGDSAEVWGEVTLRPAFLADCYTTNNIPPALLKENQAGLMISI